MADKQAAPYSTPPIAGHIFAVSVDRNPCVCPFEVVDLHGVLLPQVLERSCLPWMAGGHERPGCKVKGKSGSPNTPPAVSSPSTGTNSICMLNGLTYGGHSSKKVVLPIRKMARKVLGGACRECSKVVARWRDRGGASTLGLCA